MDIGARISFFRNQQKITVNKLANLSGVSQSYLRDIELGNKQPTVEYLEYICDGLGITLRDFFDTEKIQSSTEKGIETLNSHQRSLLNEFLSSL